MAEDQGEGTQSEKEHQASNYYWDNWYDSMYPYHPPTCWPRLQETPQPPVSSRKSQRMKENSENSKTADNADSGEESDTDTVSCWVVYVTILTWALNSGFCAWSLVRPNPL